MPPSDTTYRLIFDASPEAIWVYDVETLRFLAVNETTCERYGYTEDELLSMTILDIRPEEDRGRGSDAVNAGRFAGGDWRHRRKDGSILWSSILSKPIAFDGRSARLVFARDVTEAKRLEQQVLQASRMEAVGRLAGGVAHDFNNILTAILGFCDLLKSQLAAEDRLLRPLDEISMAGERAVKLTAELLAFSRKQILASVVMDLNDVVRGVEPMLRRLTGERVDLRVALHEPLVLKADPAKLEQVLVNLVINARDALEGPGRITIETGAVQLDEESARSHGAAVPPGPYALLAVTDTGAGMDAETQAHLFEPFFTTKGVGRGSGLGLSTVYGIVKQSGGFVWVYSELGVGTAFRVYLPRVGGVPANPLNPTEAVVPLPLTGNESILVIEDEDSVRDLVASVLRRAGYRVVAKSRLEGDDVAPDVGDVDLLVTDVVMPGLNGREVARRVRAARPIAKVLFVSGYTEDAIVHKGILDPDAKFLSKPFTPRALLKKVREVLESSS